MKMIRYTLIFLITLSGTAVLAQSQIKFSSVKLSVDDRTFEGRDQQFPISEKESLQREVINAGGAVVEASVKVKRMKSRISEHKAQGVRMTIEYTCHYLGEKRKDKHERIVWPEDKKEFNETVKFSFGKGLKPIIVKTEFVNELVLQ